MEEREKRDGGDGATRRSFLKGDARPQALCAHPTRLCVFFCVCFVCMRVMGELYEVCVGWEGGALQLGDGARAGTTSAREREWKPLYC